MATTSDVSSRIVNTLAATVPQLDTSIGTPVRKIIDACAQEIALSTTDTYLNTYQYDIDSKTGGDLDDFCANFGIARLAGSRATGVVTFSRPAGTAALRASNIPPGTQVGALTSPPVYVQTTIGTVLPVGQNSIDIPVKAAVSGVSGNLDAAALTTLLSSIDGVTTVTNANAITGGAVAETDAQLIARFKQTVFRNLAGTDSMYRATALQTAANASDPTSTAVTQVNIIGPVKHQVEQIQVVSGTATSSNTSTAYNYPNTCFVGVSLGGGNALVPGVQFTVTVNNSVSPATLVITTIGSGMPDGVYDLEYDYVPIASRNDPLGTRWSQGNINNRVDIYVNGSIIQQATQSMLFSNSLVFNNTAHSALQASAFKSSTGASPTVGDIFTPLAYGPIVSLPATMSIASTTYHLGTDYDYVQRSDAFGYTPNSTFGIWWKSSGAHPSNGASWSVVYNYNDVPSLVQDSIEGWRLLGTDVQVHAGIPAYLMMHFAIIYLPNYSVGTVNTNITAALTTFLNGLGFDAGLQISDIIQVVHAVAGVDNVRMLSSSDDGTNYGIQLVQANGTVISTYNNSGRPVDVYFNDNTYPSLYNIRILPKARNTFRN